MRFEARLAPAVGREAVIAVDGSLEGAVLELSHWPGNRTPQSLRHRLSTGVALNFARLDERERERLAAGAQVVQNNHYDTDGLCALLAVLEPELALRQAPLLLGSAEAGDFFRVPSRLALSFDLCLGALADKQRSPLASELAGLSAFQRWQRAALYALEHLPRWLEDARLPAELQALCSAPVERIEADLEALRPARRRERPALELCNFGLEEESALDTERTWARLPGRHALHQSSAADSVGLSLATRHGHLQRYLWNPSGWFDLPGRTRQVRPRLSEAAARLNALEGLDPTTEHAWRAQDESGAAPELWCGSAEQELFAEHNLGLKPSRLAPEQVELVLVECLPVQRLG